MESTTHIKYIGNYRIRYNGTSLIVPVDEQGKLHLPDGKVLQLSEDQFAVVRQKIEERRAIENSAKSMTMPTAEEIAGLYTAQKKKDSKEGLLAPNLTHESGESHKEPAAETEPKQLLPDESLSVEKEKPDKRAAIEEERAKKKAEADALKAEKRAALEAAKAEKAANIEAEKAKKKAAKEEAERKAQERKAAKQKEKEERKASVSQATKLSIIATALASVLITVVIFAGIFLYFVNSGFITINSNPRVNGLVIYDDPYYTTSTSNASYNSGDATGMHNVMDFVSL